jgi:hypothetical protein
MNNRTKTQGISVSTPILNVAYKPTSRRIVRKTGEKASAAEDVNDLRPLRGALSRVIDILLASAPSQLWGADAPLFLKKGGIYA